IENRPLLISLIEETKEAIRAFINNPRLFISGLIRSDHLCNYRPYFRIELHIAILIWFLLGLLPILYYGGVRASNASFTENRMELVKIVDLSHAHDIVWIQQPHLLKSQNLNKSKQASPVSLPNNVGQPLLPIHNEEVDTTNQKNRI